MPSQQDPLALPGGVLRLGGQGLAGHFAIVAAARHSGIQRGRGVAAGSNAVIAGAVWIEVFGSRMLGLVRGMDAAIMVTMTAASPVLLGVLLSFSVDLVMSFLPVIAYAVIVPVVLAPLTLQKHKAGGRRISRR